MKTLAWAKLSTPIMLKMSVRPLDSMKSRSPYTAPLRSENTTRSVTGRERERLRPLHLAGCRQRRLGGVELHVGDEPEPRALDLVFRLVREGRHEERLQELVVVGAHLHGTERRIHLQPLERARELYRV